MTPDRFDIAISACAAFQLLLDLRKICYVILLYTHCFNLLSNDMNSKQDSCALCSVTLARVIMVMYWRDKSVVDAASFVTLNVE